MDRVRDPPTLRVGRGRFAAQRAALDRFGYLDIFQVFLAKGDGDSAVRLLLVVGVDNATAQRSSSLPFKRISPAKILRIPRTLAGAAVRGSVSLVLN